MNAPANIPKSRHHPHSPRAIAFYKLCRTWHGYLSAFAFLVLIFFSASGIVLNHPDWLAAEEPEPATITAKLAAADVAAARHGPDAARALAALAAKALPLTGAYSTADIDGGQAVLRFDGVKGSSSVTIDLASGAATARVGKADTLSILDDLHRGKNAGPVWQALIDISGALILALSLLGYVLFFAMRFRLRTSLTLTAASIAVLAGIVIFFVP